MTPVFNLTEEREAREFAATVAQAAARIGELRLCELFLEDLRRCAERKIKREKRNA